MKFVFLTTNDINKFMALALTRGISHWCKSITTPITYNGWFSDALSAGHEVWLTEASTDETYLITLGKLVKGLGLYADRHSLPLADYSLNLGKINSVMADHIIQYAVFGEVKYA